jgi:hypothetical protein
MKISIIKNNNIVKFEFYTDGALWYSIKDGENKYTFPVPIEEAKGGIFRKTDKALYFMRFIRKAIENKTYGTEEIELLFPADAKVFNVNASVYADGNVVLKDKDWFDLLEALELSDVYLVHNKKYL